MKFLSCALVALTLLATPTFAASGTLAKHHKKHKQTHGAHHRQKQKASATPSAPSADTSVQTDTPKITT